VNLSKCSCVENIRSIKNVAFLWIDCAFVYVVSLQLINSTDISFDI
jgi:hypothetical protein